jgi:hypothetical protein
MKLFIAGHGHRIEGRKKFVKWLRKHESHFLGSYANLDLPRMKFAKKERKRNGSK